MIARIYRASPSATQSGPGPAKAWVLEFEPERPREIDPLMGWTSSADMKQQITLRFSAKEEAVAYAERNFLPYRVDDEAPRARTRPILSYSDNFRTTRKGQWTH